MSAGDFSITSPAILMQVFSLLVQKRKDAESEIVAARDEIAAKQEELSAKLHQLDGIDAEMIELHQALTVLSKHMPIKPPDLPPELNSKRLSVTPKEFSAKAIAEDALRQAYPLPLRARVIREKLGGEVTEKAVGMLLYRLQNAGAVRRSGWDWYYVPSEEREQQALQTEDQT